MSPSRNQDLTACYLEEYSDHVRVFQFLSYIWSMENKKKLKMEWWIDGPIYQPISLSIYFHEMGNNGSTGNEWYCWQK